MKSRKKYCALTGMVFLMSIGAGLTSYAGNINGNEQSIVSVIHGQFEKDGVIYSVKQDYINSAVSYLSRDDVDLTADQAQAVISEIYANVQTGVESGYLVAVGGTPQTAPAPDGQAGGSQAGTGQPDSSRKPNGTQNGSGNGGSVTPGNGTTGVAGSDANGSNPNGSNPNGSTPDASQNSDTSNNEANGETNSGTNNETDNNGTADTSSDPNASAPTEVPKVISILELVDKAPAQSYEYISRDTDALMAQIHFPYEILMWFLICMAVVMAVVAGIAAWKGLFTNHHHRKFRGVLKAIVTVEIGALTGVILTIFSVWIGAFQDSAVLNKLADTGYYHTIYDELRRDTSISFALLDIPDEVMDHSITYERVVTAARQQVASDLSAGTYQADTSMLTEQLEADIQTFIQGKSVVMTEQAENGLKLLMERLEEKYSSLLRWPFADWWLQFCGNFLQAVRILLPVSLILLAAAHVLLLFLHHYKHRAVTLCGKGVLVGGAVVFAAAVAGFLWSRTLNLSVEPAYMASFFSLYCNGIFKAGMFLGGIGAFAGLLYIVIVRAWKEGKK